jgi:hypothetical protein
MSKITPAADAHAPTASVAHAAAGMAAAIFVTNTRMFRFRLPPWRAPSCTGVQMCRRTTQKRTAPATAVL